MKKIFLILSCTLCIIHCVFSQERIEPIPYGDMEQWAVRYIKESAMLGGKTKMLYVLAPTDTIRGNKAYTFENTLWGISNAYAAPVSTKRHVLLSPNVVVMVGVLVATLVSKLCVL